MATELGLNTPSTLATMTVDTGLLQTSWRDGELYMESLKQEPLLNSESIINKVEVGPGKNMITMSESSFIIDCTPKDKKGKASRTIEVMFLKALDDAPREGNNEPMTGNEETLRMKYTSVKANDWAKGVARDTYGIDFRELQLAYGVYDKVKPLIAQYIGELRGYYMRYAFHHKHSPNLEKAPISESSSALNPNFYFPGLALASQPAYDPTFDTFENYLGNAAVLAGGTTNVLTVPTILTLIDWLRDTRYIQPDNFGGVNTYLMMTSPDEFFRMRDPSQDNSWGRYYRDIAATDNLGKIVPAVPKIQIAEEMVLVRDPRAAEVTLSGSLSAYNFAFKYDKYGRATSKTGARGSSGAYTQFNSNIVLGKGALCKYEPEMPHYEEQSDRFDKNNNIGLFGAVGYYLPIWDVDSGDANASTAQQESSCIVLTSRF